jgi:hypothetical protein
MEAPHHFLFLRNIKKLRKDPTGIFPVRSDMK